MRLLAIALVTSFGCGDDHTGPLVHDAKVVDSSTPDVDQPFCDAPAGSAHVSIVDAGVTTTAMRVHAGAVLESGPVAPALNATPMAVRLLFTDADHVPLETAGCCQSPGSGCCTLDGVSAALGDGITSATALGTHPIMVIGLHDETFRVRGTLTITSFVDPFDQLPGRIAGTISTTDSSVSGTLDNAFCAALLTVTI